MLKLIGCWDLKEHPIKIIIIKNHKGKISIEFPESANLEKSYFTNKMLNRKFYEVEINLQEEKGIAKRKRDMLIRMK